MKHKIFKGIFTTPTTSNSDENHANELILAGKIDYCKEVYMNIIQSGNASYVSYSNLGVIYLLSKNHNQAKDQIIRSIEMNPIFPEGLYNLGLINKMEGKYEIALESFIKASLLKPEFLDAYQEISEIFSLQSKYMKAINGYKKILSLKPTHLESLKRIADIYQKMGKNESSIHYLMEVRKIIPKDISITYRIADLYYNNKNYSLSIEFYTEAIKNKKNFSLALYNRANAYQMIGNFDNAFSDYKEALEINPHSTEILNNLGNLYMKLSDNNKAKSCFMKGLKITPNNIDSLLGLGNVYAEDGIEKQALSLFKKVISIDINNPIANTNIGILLHSMGNIDRAIKTYEKVLRTNPENIKAKYCLGVSLLTKGDYAKGFEYYEWRRFKGKRQPNSSIKFHLKKTDLTKLENISIITEQGLGDTIHFIRYVLFLEKMNKNIILITDRKLHQLLKISGLQSKLVSKEDRHSINNNNLIPLLSIPRYLNVSPTNPLITSPYLKPDNQTYKYWKTKSRNIKQFIIGVNWQGNPNIEKNNLRGRSFQLSILEPISIRENIKLLSLQKGYGSEQLKICTFRDKFVNYQQEINKVWKFHHTAGIIKSCDLVITTDTCIAHLSGALGKPTWLLLHKTPDWRWGLQGKTTFWYPSMRLFRQKKQGDWNEVIERLTIELDRLLLLNK